MAIFNLIEPALAIEIGGISHGITFGIEDILVFPHIDSCVALIGHLSDDRLVGAHVSMQKPDADAPLDAKGNAIEAMQAMLTLVDGSATIEKIDAVVQEGNEFYWEDELSVIADKAGCQVQMYTVKGNNGVDLTVYSHGAMEAVKYKGKISTGIEEYIKASPMIPIFA